MARAATDRLKMNPPLLGWISPDREGLADAEPNGAAERTEIPA